MMIAGALKRNSLKRKSLKRNSLSSETSSSSSTSTNSSLSSSDSSSSTNSQGNIEILRKKLILIGDARIGKTSLLSSFACNYFDAEEYISTVFDSFHTTVTVPGLFGQQSIVNISMLDCSSSECYRDMRKLTYHQVDVFCVCFSFDDKQSLLNVTDKWLLEINEYLWNNSLMNTPIVLVGLKSDLKAKSEITTDLIDNARSQLRHHLYFECSSKERENVNTLFTETIQYLLLPQRKEDDYSFFEIIPKTTTNPTRTSTETVNEEETFNVKNSQRPCSWNASSSRKSYAFSIQPVNAATEPKVPGKVKRMKTFIQKLIK
ncbi:hypothetical protein ABK040_002443 [Willaertia magna]